MDGHCCKGNQSMKDQDINKTSFDSPSIDQCHKQAISRSNCYGLLALIFRDTLSSKMIEQLRSPPLAETMAELGYDVAEELTGELEEITELLAQQYTRTFIGPGPHIPLYASVHCCDENRLWGDSTVWVKRFIEMTGLSFNDNWDSIPDHITIELELMQRLTDHETRLWDRIGSTSSDDKQVMVEKLCQCLKLQEQFLGDHLSKWIPQFAERVSKMPDSLFYREMTGLTESVVLSDVEHLATVMNTLQHNVFADGQ